MRRETFASPLRRALTIIEFAVIGAAIVASMVSGLIGLGQRLFG